MAPKDIKLKIFAPPERKVSLAKRYSQRCDSLNISCAGHVVFDMDRRVDLGWTWHIPQGKSRRLTRLEIKLTSYP